MLGGVDSDHTPLPTQQHNSISDQCHLRCSDQLVSILPIYPSEHASVMETRTNSNRLLFRASSLAVVQKSYGIKINRKIHKESINKCKKRHYVNGCQSGKLGGQPG